jgi:hypothetical protein
VYLQHYGPKTSEHEYVLILKIAANQVLILKITASHVLILKLTANHVLILKITANHVLILKITANHVLILKITANQNTLSNKYFVLIEQFGSTGTKNHTGRFYDLKD